MGDPENGHVGHHVSNPGGNPGGIPRGSPGGNPGGNPTEARLDCLVVGAGPAGLMAGEQLARAGHRVGLFDARPNFGRKLLLAGRSGLNLTHSEPLPDFQARYTPDQSAAIAGCLAAFGPKDLCAFSEDLGEATMIGSSGRVFPKSWHATGFLRAWLKRLDALGLAAFPRHKLQAIEALKGGGWRVGFETPSGQQWFHTRAVVLAMGGASWPQVGSAGEWVAVTQALGCLDTPFWPANCGLTCNWSAYFQDRFAGHYWKGLRLRLLDQEGAPLTAPSDGDVSLTKTGLESGAIYPISVHASQPCLLEIDFKPQIGRAQLAQQIAKLRPRSSLAKRAAALKLPASFVPLLKEAPQESADLLDWIKAFRLPIAGNAGLERAISTRGGLALSELDDTLQIQRAPGIWAAGEMLAWDAPTGGYLLQACFSQGFVAGRAAAQWLAQHQTA